jgi:adenylosuccinate lyase
VIQRHSLAVADALRTGASRDNDLLARLADDPQFPLSREELERLLGAPLELVGNAPAQVAEFVKQVETLASAHPDAARYRPGRLL